MVANLIAFFKTYWLYISAVAALISAIVVFLKDYENLVYLINQNKLLRKKKIAKDKKELSNTIGVSLVHSSINGNRKYLKKFKLEFSDIAVISLKNFLMEQEQILDLVGTEFKSHEILSRIDYEFTPIALKSGFYVVLSKLGNRLTFEEIRKSILDKEVYESWKRFSDAYFKAHRLSFRKNHFLLAREMVFAETIKVIREMHDRLSEYLFLTRLVYNEQLFVHLHDLKNNATSALHTAEDMYYLYSKDGDDEKLSKSALHLDMVISTIHKILVEYPLQQ